MCIHIDDAIIEWRLKAADEASVIGQMGARLLEAGLVREDFVEAVIQRERKFPTGLPTPIPVALCHTDPEYVITSFISVATLDRPVPFHEMGNPTHVQPVEIVFLLGIAEKGRHMDILKNVLKVIQNAELLGSIRAAGSKEEILKIVVGCLQPDPQ